MPKSYYPDHTIHYGELEQVRPVKVYIEAVPMERTPYIELADTVLELCQPPEHGSTYSPRELRLRQRLFRLSSSYFNETEAHHEQRIRANTDKLTGTRSQRAYIEQFPVLVQEAHAQSKPLAVAFIDLDNFKRVNDEIGHDEGDKLLRKVGTTLLSIMRAGDYVWRDGGDEFKLAMPNFGSERHYTLTDRHYSMERVGIKVRDIINEVIGEEGYAAKLGVGASLGICMLRDGEEAVSFMSRIEDEMAKDKEMRKQD